MVKFTTKQKILNYMGLGAWHSGTELESKAEAWRTKSSVISRRARELVNEGKLERTIYKGAVQYRLASQMSAREANQFIQGLNIKV